MAEIHPIYVFEVAQAIDLDRAERSVGRESARPPFRYRGRATSLFQYRPAPLRISEERPGIAVGEWATDPGVELVLYDFGAASVTYRLSIPGDLEALQQAASVLQGDSRLRADARARAESLVASVAGAGAVQRPQVADLMEEYTILGMRDVPTGESAGTYCAHHAEAIARILRPSEGSLSGQEVADATSVRISFGPSDVTIVDWDAAFVLDKEPEDVRAVLEFANVQLLEMRWLDLQLDDAIERSYQLLARRPAGIALPWDTLGGDLRQVAELQLESAVLLERVTNALKVFGEEYLARIYRLAAGRLQLGALDATITRKLATIESIYQKLSDRASTRRMEFLEWVVILLIAVEVVLGLFR
ncbi:MAG TPA: hypothetical protein VMG41_11385 [Gemmatimonadales bacterium]|nr:hypothetical protein [Gemmatimonadales bacterium]